MKHSLSGTFAAAVLCLSLTASPDPAMAQFGAGGISAVSDTVILNNSVNNSLSLNNHGNDNSEAASQARFKEIEPLLRAAVADPSKGPADIRTALEGDGFPDYFVRLDAKFIPAARKEVMGDTRDSADAAQTTRIIETAHEMGNQYRARLAKMLFGGFGVAALAFALLPLAHELADRHEEKQENRRKNPASRSGHSGPKP